jgi:hypothetical protein
VDRSIDLPAAPDVNRLVDRAGLWPARLLWLVAPATAGPAVARLLGDRPDGPALVVEVALWALWFVVLVATLTPSPLSLTVSRVAGPVAVGGAVLILAADGADGATTGALLWALLATGVLFLPANGDRMINGSAYGSERRMALRPPGFVLVGPVQVAWLGVFAGLVLPAALVLAGRWWLAAVVGAVGAVTAWAGLRILHQLSRRWVVFVPAGFVIRDPMTLVDAILFRRNQVVALGPALADGPGDGGDRARTDLSGGARGLALEVALREPTPITLRVRNRAENVEVANIVFTPTLPGALLAEARIRGLKIGAASDPG